VTDAAIKALPMKVGRNDFPLPNCIFHLFWIGTMHLMGMEKRPAICDSCLKRMSDISLSRLKPTYYPFCTPNDYVNKQPPGCYWEHEGH